MIYLISYSIRMIREMIFFIFTSSVQLIMFNHGNYMLYVSSSRVKGATSCFQIYQKIA